MGRVAGKIAMITGGRRGIGRATAELLAKEGAKVVITDRKQEGSDEVIETIQKAGGEAIFILQDVAKEEDWQNTISKVIEHYGKLDILVNNAGVGAGKNVENMTLEDWRWVMSINLDGVFLGIKYAIKVMKKDQNTKPKSNSDESRSIINLASIEGLVGDRRLAAYDASKGAVRMLTKSAALHCAKSGYNIRINSVCPGFLNTKMVSGFLGSQENPKDAEAKLIAMHPIGHLGEPLDAAYAILYLASDESKFVTGSDLCG